MNINKKYKVVNTISNLDKEDTRKDYPIFCTFYTVDNGYKKYFTKLKQSLEKFNLPYYAFEMLREHHSWEKYTQQKPHILKLVLTQYPNHNVVWIDSDGIIERLPEVFLQIPLTDKSIGVHYLHGKELYSATMFFKNNATSLQILEDWILVTKENNLLYKQKKIPLTKTWDQAILKKVIKIKGYREHVYHLPPEYACIFDNSTCPPNTWVISQWQASRNLKYIQGK